MVVLFFALVALLLVFNNYHSQQQAAEAATGHAISITFSEELKQASERYIRQREAEKAAAEAAGHALLAITLAEELEAAGEEAIEAGEKVRGVPTDAQILTAAATAANPACIGQQTASFFKFAMLSATLIKQNPQTGPRTVWNLFKHFILCGPRNGIACTRFQTSDWQKVLFTLFPSVKAIAGPYNCGPMDEVELLID